MGAVGARVDHYLALMELLFSPDVFIIGGGVSRSSTNSPQSFARNAEVVVAQLLNEAGIVRPPCMPTNR